jgi:hypothetical protein
MEHKGGEIMGQTTWGAVLLLVENTALASHRRPARFGTAAREPLVTQFSEWPAIYQAALALNLHSPGQRIRATVLAITRLLGEHYSLGQVRQLPLAEVVAFLQHAHEQGAAVEEGGTPAPPGNRRAGSGGVTPAASEQGRAGCSRRVTAAELVGRCLTDNPAASLKEVMSETGLTEGKIRRTSAWKDHEEGLLNDYLKDCPQATTADVAAALGFSAAKTAGMRAWKDHRARREAARPRHQVKERPLARATLECRPDKGTVDPTETAERRELIFRAVLEDADRDTKARLNGLTDGEREALGEHVLMQMDDGAWEGRGQAETRAIVAEVVRSWLEDHEQERRRQGRRGR